MITKILDGCFFFLVFKICQWLWDALPPNLEEVTGGVQMDTSEALELLGNRFDHFEDILYQLKEASQ